MCLTCGCGDPDADHDNPDNITYEDLQKAAEAAEVSIEEAVENIKTTLNEVEDVA